MAGRADEASHKERTRNKGPAMVYRKRPDLPSNPAAAVAILRAARESMRRIQDEVRPFGPAYIAADAVNKAINAFATLLTGDRDYFHADTHGGGHGLLGTQQEKLMRERGDAPWKRLE